MILCSGVFTVYAEDSTSTATADTSNTYEVTIPSEVTVSDSKQASLPVSSTLSSYTNLNISVTSQNGFLLKNTSDTKSLSYTIDKSSLSHSTEGASSTFQDDIQISVKDDTSYAGVYSDLLQFNISGAKKRYNLDLNGSVDGKEQEGLDGDFPGVAEVDTYINGVQVGSSAYGWWDQYDAGTTFKFVIHYDPSKYALSNIQNWQTDLPYTDDGNGTASVEGVVDGSNVFCSWGDVRVDLKFTAKEYTLSFDANEGECDEPDRLIKYNTVLDSLPTPIREGYSFLGWYTEKEGGTKVDTSSKMFNQDTTLYAHWEVQKFHFDINGRIDDVEISDGSLGSVATCDIWINGVQIADDVTDVTDWAGTLYEYGTTFEVNDIKINNPDKYEFTGVYDGTLTGTITKDTRVDLEFTTKKNLLTFDANGGECSELSREIIVGESIGTLPEPTKENCVFAGWFTDATDGVQIDADTVITESTTVYAHWLGINSEFSPEEQLDDSFEISEEASENPVELIEADSNNASEDVLSGSLEEDVQGKD